MAEGNGNGNGNGEHATAGIDWNQARDFGEALEMLRVYFDKRIAEESEKRTREHAEVVQEISARADKTAKDLLEYQKITRAELLTAARVVGERLDNDNREFRASIKALTERADSTSLVCLRTYDMAVDARGAIKSLETSIERTETVMRDLRDRVADMPTVSTNG